MDARKLWIVVGLLTVSLSLSATTDTIPTKKNHPKLTTAFLDLRGGYEAHLTGGQWDNEGSGAKGYYAMVKLSVQLTEGLSFTYRQQLNKLGKTSFFETVDWMFLNWRANKWLGLTAGRLPVAIGGIEYDAYPLDFYYGSEFIMNIPCYKWGGAASFFLGEKDELQLMVTQSPLMNYSGVRNTAAINLLWRSQHGIWSPIWSINALQRDRNGWMGYVALGNRLDFCRWCRLDLDAMLRTGMQKGTWTGKDWTFIGELSFTPIDAVRAYGKMSYDFNLSGNSADQLVWDGTKIASAMVGVEYMPVKSYREALRLYASASYSWGTNTNPNGAQQDKDLRIQLGAKCMIDFLRVARKLKVEN